MLPVKCASSDSYVPPTMVAVVNNLIDWDNGCDADHLTFHQVDGILAVHEFHIWQLAGDRIIASAHVGNHVSDGYH